METRPPEAVTAADASAPAIEFSVPIPLVRLRSSLTDR